MDKKALKILSTTYWSSKGWKDEKSQVTPTEDFHYAKRAGLMFDPVRISHDEIVQRALDVVARVDPEAVSNGFLASLSSRRLDLRSALGSFVILRHFPAHDYQRGPGKACRICGKSDNAVTYEDLNILNFERFKWGGVRHDHPIYATFDLERFLETKPVAVDLRDRVIFAKIIEAIRAIPPDTTASKLQEKLAGIFPSNKAEREVLIGILGYTGILRTPGHPGFRNQFIAYSDRDDPPQRFVEMGYPASWWRGRYGLDEDAIRAYFPNLEF